MDGWREGREGEGGRDQIDTRLLHANRLCMIPIWRLEWSEPPFICILIIESSLRDLLDLLCWNEVLHYLIPGVWEEFKGTSKVNNSYTHIHKRRSVVGTMFDISN